MATSQVISQVPRYAVEPIAFGLVVVLVVYVIAQQRELAGIVSMLGFYAFAGYRLLPAVQQGFQGDPVHGAALENLLTELEEAHETAQGAAPAAAREHSTAKLRLQHHLVLAVRPTSSFLEHGGSLTT